MKQGNLQVARPRLEMIRKNFSHKGAKECNDIPNNKKCGV